MTLDYEKLNRELTASDHTVRCRALSEIGRCKDAEPGLESLVAGCLADPYPIVIRHALEALQQFRPLSESTVRNILSTFSIYVSERGCAYSCCGIDALTHPEIIEGIEPFLLEAFSNNPQAFILLIKGMIDADSLSKNNVNEIFALLSYRGVVDSSRVFTDVGLEVSGAGTFFLS